MVNVAIIGAAIMIAAKFGAGRIGLKTSPVAEKTTGVPA
jgi:hypothetical protein